MQGVGAARGAVRLERHCATVLLEWNRIGRDECSCWCTLETHLPTRVVDRALRKVGRSKQHSALMREGLERSLTHASARRDREGPSADEDGEPSVAHRPRDGQRGNARGRERDESKRVLSPLIARERARADRTRGNEEKSVPAARICCRRTARILHSRYPSVNFSL